MKNMIQTILVATVSVVMMVACNKKGGDSAPPPPPVPVQPTCVMSVAPPPGMLCVNGLLIPNPAGVGHLLSDVKFEENSGVFSGSMSISALNGTVDAADPRFFTRYFGQATFTGQLIILAPICNGTIPAGAYTFSGTGNFNAGTVSIPNLTLSGPTVIQWQVTGGSIYAENGYPETNGPSNRIQMVSMMTFSTGVFCDGRSISY
ncbi:MAG: hypothetical protein ACXWC9_04480 [Pseudobdellovibrionaceae bacterium]